MIDRINTEFSPLAVEPVRRRKLSEEVAERLQTMMLSGQLKPDQVLPSERQLMTMFNVGRASIREALYSLQRMGLISIRNGERTCVTKPSVKVLVGELSGVVAHILADPQCFRELLQARTLYEILLVRFAAMHASDTDIIRLKMALDENRNAIGHLTEFAKTDVAFHQILAEIPQNSIFTSLQTELASWLTDQRVVSLSIKGAEQDAYKAHQAIYDAVVGRDPDAAERAMHRHLTNVGEFYLRALDSGYANPFGAQSQSLQSSNNSRVAD